MIEERKEKGRHKIKIMIRKEIINEPKQKINLSDDIGELKKALKLNVKKEINNINCFLYLYYFLHFQQKIYIKFQIIINLINIIIFFPYI